MLSFQLLSTELQNASNVLVVDGGLATELESRGECISDALWSSRLLIDRPELLEEVHLDYMRSGASFVLTASYQASVAGLCKLKHLSEEAAMGVIASSVSLVEQARTRFLAEGSGRRVWIGASVGPYGAYLADGSEYRGDYETLDRFSETIAAFHRPRLLALLSAKPDFIAFETLPLVEEAILLLDLLDEVASDSPILCWVSFCCRDGESIANGSSFADAVRAVAVHPRVFAVGCNCVAPKYVSSLIAHARRSTEKPIVVYPNMGEVYDGVGRCWLPDSQQWEEEAEYSSAASSSTTVASSSSTASDCFAKLASNWADQGTPLLVGGCCRTTPAVMARLASQFPNPAQTR